MKLPHRIGLLLLAAIVPHTRAPLALALDSTQPQPATSAPAAAHPDHSSFTVAADYSADLSGRALLVLIDGKTVFERYDNKWSAERPHPLASGTKSFTGVAAMFAVQDGLLTLDELASDTLTEWKADPQKSRITIRHLLTLSSGLDPSDATLGGKGGSRLLGEVAGLRAKRNGADKAEQPGDLFAAAINVPTLSEPGQKFRYGPSHFYAFGELLERKLRASNIPQKTILDYMHASFMDPIGMKVAYFGKDAAGHPNLPGGCLLTAREWARFGQFILQDGAWKQPDGFLKPLIKKDLLAECFKPSQANPSYGLTWWLRNAVVVGANSALAADTGGVDIPATSDKTDTQGRQTIRDRIRQRLQQRQRSRDAQAAPIADLPEGFTPPEVRMAAGLGKQRLYIIPEYNMVIVRFAEATRNGLKFDDRQFIGRILGLIPADQPAPSHPAPTDPAR